MLCLDKFAKLCDATNICMSGFNRRIYSWILLTWYLPQCWSLVNSAVDLENLASKPLLSDVWDVGNDFNLLVLLRRYSTVPFDVNTIWAAFHPLMAQGHFNLKTYVMTMFYVTRLAFNRNNYRIIWVSKQASCGKGSDSLATFINKKKMNFLFWHNLLLIYHNFLHVVDLLN